MFEELSYVGYNALFCIPPLILMWLRREFFKILVSRLKIILFSSLILTVYGSLIWPIALQHGAWAYSSDKITNITLFGYVYIDDVMWWLLVSLLFSSAVTLGIHYERQGVDIFWREFRGLYRSFINAFRGFRIITMERNSHGRGTMFDTPSLRGIWLTSPYFHDGSAATLEDLLRMGTVHNVSDGLDDSELLALMSFLESLPNRDQ